MERVQIARTAEQHRPAVTPAALGELRRYPFFAAGGDGFDRLSGFARAGQEGAAERREAERLALSVALCQSHAKVRAIEKLLTEALDAIHRSDAGAAIPPTLAALLGDTGSQLVALGNHFRASE
jgi:hypothetical protein